MAGLLALCQPKWVSELAHLDLQFMSRDTTSVVFALPIVTKTQRAGSSPISAHYVSFPSDPLLCPITLISAYLHRTASLWGSHQRLLLSYCKPFAPVSAQPVSRWVVTCLSAAGIDTSVFKAHSTRAASTSKVVAASLPIGQVLEAGNWSDKSNTFAHFYHRSPADATVSFSETLLRYSF